MTDPVLDFPTAWAIQNRGGLEHHPRCSSVSGWHPLSGPALLCDCGAVRREWERQRALRAPAPAEPPASDDLREALIERFEQLPPSGAPFLSSAEIATILAALRAPATVADREQGDGRA